MKYQPTKLPAEIVDPNPNDPADYSLSLTLKMSAKWGTEAQCIQFGSIMDLLYSDGCPLVIVNRCWNELIKTKGPCTVYVGTLKQCLLVKGSFEQMGAIVETCSI